MKGIMKKTVLLFGLVSVLVLGGCGQKESIEPIEVAALNGPTGIGMVKLMANEKDKTVKAYNVTLYQSPDEIVGKVVSGEIDIACVPSNMGAVLYNKTQGEVKLLGTNTLGTLYIVENGETITKVEDLKGKVILASGKDSTPEFVLNYILKQNGLEPGQDVTIEFMGNHSDMASKLLADKGTIALLPQPFVTTAMAKNEDIHTAVNINNIWQEVNQMDLPMGIIIGRKEFIDANPKGLENFLKDYKASVTYVSEHLDDAAELVASFEIIPNAQIAKKAIPACNIVYRDHKESRGMLNQFYEILANENVKAVGGKLPDEGFYSY